MTGDKSFIERIEVRAKKVKEEIIGLNNKGELDILSLLEIVGKRIGRQEIEDSLKNLEIDKESVDFFNRVKEENERFNEELEAYNSSEFLLRNFDFLLDDKKKLEEFKEAKKDWMRFRKHFMFGIKLMDEKLVKNFIFLECLFRMLLIWHENIGFMNAKKNLRMVNHLIVKYELNEKFKKNSKFVKSMNFLGKRFENSHLKKRLKMEDDIEDDAVTKKLKIGGRRDPLESSNEKGSSKMGSLVGRIVQENSNNLGYDDENLSFLSKETGSSFSFDPEDKKNPKETNGANLQTNGDLDKLQSGPRNRADGEPSEERTPRSDTNKVDVDQDVREITFEKLKDKLKEMIPDKKAKIIAKNLEAQLFARFYQNEVEYDKIYGVLIYALTTSFKESNLVARLFEQYFDFDLLLDIAKSRDKSDTLTGKDSIDKMTQTFLGVKLGAGSLSLDGKRDHDSKILDLDLRDSETIYLQKLVNKLRKENKYLKNLVFELRLEITGNKED